MDYAKESLRLHGEWKGKIEMVTRVPVKTKDDLSLAYTPGVAQPCLNEARFSNIFIEKRASTCPQSLEKSRLFSYALLVSECENFQNMKRIFLRKVVI